MMLRNETWMVALEGLWANKIRAFLTTLGVVIGSACIVLVVTVAVTGRRYVIAQIEATIGSLAGTALRVAAQGRECAYLVRGRPVHLEPGKGHRPRSSSAARASSRSAASSR